MKTVIFCILAYLIGLFLLGMFWRELLTTYILILAVAVIFGFLEETFLR